MFKNIVDFLKKDIDVMKYVKRKLDYIVCFVVSLIIITSIYILKKATPFGINTLLDSDFFYQYGVMLAEFRDRILDSSNLLYSFRSGLGLPLYRNFLNYLASPINIISFIFPRDKFMVSFSFIIGLKAILSSCTMYFCMKKRYVNKEETDNKWLFIPMAILYGFSGFFSSYYINIMWLDSMILLPVLVGTIDDLVVKSKYAPYSICLAIIIAINYYMGYMICIFACFYFIYSYILNNSFKGVSIKVTIKNFLKKSVLFGVFSIFSALLCITPLYLVTNTISSIDATTTNEEMVTEFGYDVNVIDVVLANFNGAKSNLYYGDEIHVPHIAVGALTIIMFGLFLMNYEIKLKEKILGVFLTGFYFLSFFMPQINFIMHALHEPNDYPNRYAFIYSFIIILISSKVIKTIKHIKYREIIIVFIALLLFLIAFGRSENPVLSKEILIINVVFVCVYTTIFIIGKKTNFNIILSIFLIIVTSIELIVVYDKKWDLDQDQNVFINDYNSYKGIIEYIRQTDEEKFYRTEKLSYLSLNDGCWNGYNGVTLFSSMAYNKLSEFQIALGLPGNNCDSYVYDDTSPLYNLLFDVKYVLDDFELDNSKYYKTKRINEVGINKFKYTNGIGFGTEMGLLELEFNEKTPFELQNEIVKKSSSINRNIFNKAKYIRKQVHKDENITIYKYSIDNQGDDIYFYTPTYNIDFIKIGDRVYCPNPDNSIYNEYGFVIEDIDSCEEINFMDGGIIKIQTDEEPLEIYVAYMTDDFLDEVSISVFEYDVFKEYYNIIKKEKLKIDNFDDSRIECSINLEEDKLIYTSIPYDEGWHIYVDGIEIDKKIMAESLLCFNVSKGTHKIIMEYEIPNINTVVEINIIILLIFIGIIVKTRKNVI